MILAGIQRLTTTAKRNSEMKLVRKCRNQAQWLWKETCDFSGGSFCIVYFTLVLKYSTHAFTTVGDTKLGLEMLLTTLL